MIYIYLSDEAVTLVEQYEPPQQGHHVSAWLPILKEMCQWRSVPFPNQIALPVGVRSVREVEAVIDRLKWNSVATYDVVLVCTLIKQELLHRERIVTPQNDEELDTFLAELHKGSDEEE